MRIALTGTDRGVVAERLTALGHEVVHVPLIAVGPPADGGAALHAALDRLADFRWLVVTSANGARAAGAAASRHPDLRLAAVGARTAAVLADLAGRSPDLVPAVERAEGLVDAWPTGDGGPALLTLADRAAPTLAAGLQARGVAVEVVEAYRTTRRSLSRSETDAIARSDVVMLSSGSAAESLAALGLDQRPGRRVVAIGPTTAAAAERVGLTVHAVAASPHADDVVAAIGA